MSRSRRERSLFDEKDYMYHGVPVYNNDTQSQIFVDEYAQLPYGFSQFMYQPQFYPDPMMGQMPYAQYPSSFYYPPPSSPPVQVSQTPFNKNSTNLPRAPNGRIPLQQTFVPSTPAAVNYPMIPKPAQPTAVPYRASTYDPPAPYYYPYAPPSSQYYVERVPLPRLKHGRRRSHTEHDYHNRSHREHPLIMSYFGRRHDIDQSHSKTRWYD